MWAKGKMQLRFREEGVALISDNYRGEAMGYINEIGDSLLI